MSQIGIVDCGMGNLHSVLAGVRRAAPTVTAQLVSTPSAIAQADIIIFPGDGHFGACISEIDRRGLRTALVAAAQNKPFLGICVGMQVLFAGSDEAPQARGLGVFPATIRRFDNADAQHYKVPHMGWNKTVITHPHSAVSDIADGQRFYFIHSYYAPLGSWTLMQTTYLTDFSAAVHQDRLLATQFHPEKSSHSGQQLLRQFIQHHHG